MYGSLVFFSRHSLLLSILSPVLRLGFKGKEVPKQIRDLRIRNQYQLYLFLFHQGYNLLANRIELGISECCNRPLNFTIEFHHRKQGNVTSSQQNYDEGDSESHFC